MKIILKLLIAPLLLLCILASAQVRTNFNNETPIDARGRFVKTYKIKIDFEIAAKNIADLVQAEKKKNDTTNEAQPFQLAVPVSVDLDIAKLTNWNYDADSAYGKFTIKLNGALSSSINFDMFYLPKGTEMYIYNESGNMITGPITENENNPNKVWGSWVYKGPLLTIEIKTPLSVLSQLVLHANNIAYGYKEVYKTQVGGFGQSAACEINVLCPLGNGWQNERNSVSLILSDNGSNWCSGCLVMNTCNTNRPFYLTANHCFTGQNVSAWRFTFQAWSPTCAPSQNSDGVTYNGSTLRANSAGTDFCLVELNNTPPINSGINYAGWSRNTAGITQTTIIHHPAGDVMKITRDLNPPAFGNFLGAQCWHLIVDNGTTEGGSSGSPYFDQNHRIIGQHYGIDDGNLPICNQVSKYGGRFDLSWTGGGTNTTRLSNWLDASNSGAITTNTTNVANLQANPNTFAIAGDNIFCTTSNTYTIPNLPAGATVQWTAVPPTGVVTINSPNSPQTTLNATGNGIITLTATISNICGVPITINKSIAVGVPDRPILLDEFGNEVTSVSTCTNVHKELCPTIDPKWGILEWEWEKVVGNFNLLDFQSCAQVIGFQPDFGFISVRVRNACGWSDPTLIVVNITDCSSMAMQQNSIKLYPNPATSSVTLSVDKQKNAEAKTKGEQNVAEANINEVKIYDSFGNIKFYRKYNKQQTATLDISNLKKGVYIVEVNTGSRLEYQQLIIQK